jgi:hypothetical protein
MVGVRTEDESMKGYIYGDVPSLDPPCPYSNYLFGVATGSSKPLFLLNSIVFPLLTVQIFVISAHPKGTRRFDRLPSSRYLSLLAPACTSSTRRRLDSAPCQRIRLVSAHTHQWWDLPPPSDSRHSTSVHRKYVSTVGIPVFGPTRSQFVWKGPRLSQT